MKGKAAQSIKPMRSAAGRKPISEALKKKPHSVMMTAAEYEIFEEAAGRTNKANVSQFLVWAGKEKAAELEPADD